MFADYIKYRGNLTSSEAPALRQHHWVEPDLPVSLCLFHMDVRRFVAFQAEEEKPVAVGSQHGWHTISRGPRPSAPPLPSAG